MGVFNNGLLICYGRKEIGKTATGGAWVTDSITFPLAYTHHKSCILALNGQGDIYDLEGDESNTVQEYKVKDIGNGSSNSACCWIACGY